MPLSDLMLSRSTHDRRGIERDDPSLLERLWGDERTRVLRWSAGATPVVDHEGATRLDLVAPSVVGERSIRAFLGRDVDGVAHVVAQVEHERVEGDGWEDLRLVAPRLDETDAGLFTQASALLRWHQVSTHCSRCGAATQVVSSGWVRRCPRDASQHFPRTDAAVIMAVVDDEGRLLLGHNPAWPVNRYSTLAGFVEPGETLEDAVRREVAEEVGVVVGEVVYEGDQPWPFPASLMLGFTARALTTTVTADENEITDARWFTREELPGQVERGEVLLPGPVSIAHRLVERWYGRPLPAVEEWR